MYKNTFIFQRFILLTTVTGLVFLTACSDSSNSTDTIPNTLLTTEIDNTPLANCEPRGQGANHPNATAYQALLQETVDQGFPGITAAVYTPDAGLWVGAAGYATIENQRDMQTCNVLFSGSVAKTYTVTAAMKLYEMGLYDLDDPISDYLPESISNNLPNGNVATIRQLMNHTAGMPDHDDELSLQLYVEENGGKLPSVEEQLETLYDNEPLFEPGTQAVYSSAHTMLLSLIIDNIAGEHHSHIVSREIIQKIGLTNTYYKNEIGLPKPPNLVSGYIGANAANPHNLTDAAINYANDSHGDAGIMATAYDYYRFIKGLMEGEILSETTVNLMTETYPVFQGDIEGENILLGYGLGFISTVVDDEIIKIGHSGATAGGMAHMYHYPKYNSYLVLLTNYLPDGNDNLMQHWGSGWVSFQPSSTLGFERLIEASSM